MYLTWFWRQPTGAFFWRSGCLATRIKMSQEILICLVITVTSLPLFVAEQQAPPTECDRGVKRHHPSQANAFQVFTRENYRKQWLDYTCPEYTIFDPRQCTCVESTRHQQQPQTDPESQVPKTSKTQSSDTESDTQKNNIQSTKSVGKNNPIPPWRQQAPPSAHPTRGHSGNQQPISHQVPGTNIGSANQHKINSQETERQKSVDQSKVINTQDRKPSDNDQTSHIMEPLDQQQADQETEECYLHRATSDLSHFERWTDGHWEEEDCNWPFYTGLVWNQEACRCEWGPNRTLAIPDAESSVPASCLMMLRMTFDQGEVKDEGRGIWLNIRNKEHANAQIDSTAKGGYSGAFRGSSISVPYFKSNVLGHTFHVGLMFKLCPGEPDVDIPILHNDCVETLDGPSIAVTYQAWKNQITVAMRTSSGTMLVSEVCTLTKERADWTKLDIRYGDSYLEVTADNNVCIESDKFYGPLATNNCPLTLLDESFCGNLDEVIVTRGCTEAHAVS